MVKGVWIGERCFKYVLAGSVDSSLFLRHGYKKRGPYLVKTLG